jgi:hypothetical protein
LCLGLYPNQKRFPLSIGTGQNARKVLCKPHGKTAIKTTNCTRMGKSDWTHKLGAKQGVVFLAPLPLKK